MARTGASVRSVILVSLVLAWLVCAASAFAKTKKATVTYPSGFAISGRAADMPIQTEIDEDEDGEEIDAPGPGPLSFKAAARPAMLEDPVAQKQPQPLVAASLGTSFDGIPSPGFVPSDSNLAVGPNHIVEVVNIQFAVYSKTGALLAGPTNINNLFSSLGVCSTSRGDPVVLYDRQADRWVISYIGTPAQGQASECFAVSQTSDPTGAYFVYGYSFGTNLNDYPKLSTWATASNSAYLATYNVYQNFTQLLGAEVCGADRSKMLHGDPTAAQLCQLTSSNEFTYLPGDMDGPTPPADGTPGLFITWRSSTPGQLYLRKLTMNFASGTATLSDPTIISVADASLACGLGGVCVPQAGTARTLDSLGDRAMYRFAIRHFPDHDRAVLNHAVANNGVVAERWYELYDPAGNVTVNQQGTFAPDTTYRWMGSIAEDQLGNIGLGYSASSSTIHPAIRFTGRVPSDPPGTMETEASMIEGVGSQTGTNRWGDYTAMQVDPSDDCTFWYVDQYQTVNGSNDWSTNIASFKFDDCTGGASFSLSANPNSLTVQQGSQGTSTITITGSGGFSGSVNLSASGMPSGVTAGFNPNPATSSSTLTLSVPLSTATGTSTVTITGTSGSITQQTTVQLTVTAASQPVVTLSPASLTFATFAVGKTSAAKAVTMSNTGAATLNIASIVASSDFAIPVNTCGATLAVGASCKFKVSFTPTQVGERTGAVTISDNAANSPQSVPLSGTGGPQATLTPANANFAKTVVGGTSAAKTFTLRNKQSVALTGISASTTGDFAIAGTTCGSSLAGGSSCTISVVFKPTQAGARTGTLRVSDSAIGSPQVSNLTGTGK